MKRNKFSLSHYKLLTCDMGELVPCGITEVLPGDTIQHNTSVLLRASPMLTPVMHPVDIRVHHFYVPHRLVWSEFEDFITGGPAGVSLPTFPTISFTNPAIGTLADYLGVSNGTYTTAVSALPFRGYQLIWNEFFRDQDLETELANNVASGVDATTNTALLNCDWEKDYFTSARPWEQKGPSITIPLGANAPVTGIGWEATAGFNAAGTTIRKVGGTTEVTVGTAGQRWLDTTASANKFVAKEDPANTGWPGIWADLSNASAITVNALREALALQRFEEARARYGSRYTEYLRYLGVRSSDARLQRPEYLGGGRQTFQFSEVLQTAEGANPVGTLRGHGIASMRSNRYRRFIEEHGYIFSLLSVRPKTMYMSGLPRHWNKRTKEDFWQKELEHIGQQPIENREVYAPHATPLGTFGYQDIYDDYRRQESGVSGEFRTTLNMWHFARAFGSAPALNASFVKCVPTEQPFAVPANDVLWCMAKHSIQARRLVAPTGTSRTF